MLKWLISLIFPLIVFGQEFQISYGSAFNLDPFTKYIYYVDSFDYKIKSVKIDGSNIAETIFPTIPSFAHIEHKAAFTINAVGINDSLYLYDFSEDKLYNLLNLFIITNGSSLFSPNDKKIIYSEDLRTSSYYSFEDSMTHFLDINDYFKITDWLDDSTLYCMASYGYGDSYIMKLSLNGSKIDTVLNAVDTVTYTGLSYNSQLNILAYSWRSYGNNETNVGLNLLKITSIIDSTIFEYKKDDPIGTPIEYKHLVWSPENDKLGFIGVDAINPVAQVYVYNKSADRVIRYTKPFETDDGRKSNLRWYNQDTLLYVAYKYEEPPQIYGFDILTPSSLEDSEQIIPDNMQIFNYPNPFNSTTVISFALKIPQIIEIRIYNIIGQLIYTFSLGDIESGIHQVEWDASDYSSGIYFYSIPIGQSLKIGKMILIK
jgi:hypothetical protein